MADQSFSGWDSTQRTLQQIERRLNEFGSMVKGNQDFQADRVSDLLEQIGEALQEIEKTNARLKVVEDFLRNKFSKKGKTDERQ